MATARKQRTRIGEALNPAWILCSSSIWGAPPQVRLIDAARHSWQQRAPASNSGKEVTAACFAWNAWLPEPGALVGRGSSGPPTGGAWRRLFTTPTFDHTGGGRGAQRPSSPWRRSTNAAPWRAMPLAAAVASRPACFSGRCFDTGFTAPWSRLLSPMSVPESWRWAGLRRFVSMASTTAHQRRWVMAPATAINHPPGLRLISCTVGRRLLAAAIRDGAAHIDTTDGLPPL